MGSLKNAMEGELVCSSPEPSRQPCSSKSMSPSADLGDAPNLVHNAGVASSAQKGELTQKTITSLDYPFPDEVDLDAVVPNIRHCLDDPLGREDPHDRATSSRVVPADLVLEEGNTEEQKKKKKKKKRGQVPLRRQVPLLMKILFLRCQTRIKKQDEEISQLKRRVAKLEGPKQPVTPPPQSRIKDMGCKGKGMDKKEIYPKGNAKGESKSLEQSSLKETQRYSVRTAVPIGAQMVV